MTEVAATIHRCLNRNFLGGERRLLSMFGGGVRSFPLGFFSCTFKNRTFKNCVIGSIATKEHF